MKQGPNGIFRVGDSYRFAAQIPDNSVGCSGSQCSHCNGKAAYCHQRCFTCGLPFIGPFGFPQITEWQKLSLPAQMDKVNQVFYAEKHGRLGCRNVHAIPLTPSEKWSEMLNEDQERLFEHFHRISSTDLLESLKA